MIEIANTLFQPLTLQTATGAGLHLAPRARVSIADTEVSEEMQRAARRGDILLRPTTEPVAGLVIDPAPDESAATKTSKRKEG